MGGCSGSGGRRSPQGSVKGSMRTIKARSISHWSATYARNRLALEYHQRRHPDDPWLTRDAAGLIGEWIRSGDTCLEWGSGRSTWWLASAGVHVSTVEHDPGWAQKVVERSDLADRMDLALVGGEDAHAYVGAHPGVERVDMALVDGLHRAQCALRAASVVRPGGILVVDNVERYLPSESISPESRGASLPEPGWQDFQDLVGKWRRVWTSNGVTDTAIWFAPC